MAHHTIVRSTFILKFKRRNLRATDQLSSLDYRWPELIAIIAEANYSLASAQLQLANAQNQIKVLDIQCSSLRDSVDTTRAEYEVLLSQLAEERCSSDGLKTELARLQRALWKAAHALDVADSEMQRHSVHGEATERDSKRDAGARDSSADALELAEAKLVAAAGRETSLQERLFIERAAKETAENALAAKGTYLVCQSLKALPLWQNNCI